MNDVDYRGIEPSVILPEPWKIPHEHSSRLFHTTAELLF